MFLRIQGLSSNHKYEIFVENFVKIYERRHDEIVATNDAAARALEVITEKNLQAEKIQEEIEKEEQVCEL